MTTANDTNNEAKGAGITDKRNEPATTEPIAGKTNGIDTISSVRITFFLEYMEGVRKVKAASLFTYGADYDRIVAFYGGEKSVTEIRVQSVGMFAKSPQCLNRDMTKDSKFCAKPTYYKTLRLFKMFLEWLAESGRIETAPIPRTLAMGGKSIADKEKAAKEKLAREKQAKAKKAEKENDSAKVQSPKADATAK